ncbi:hypothetical protein CBS63078_3817 [Aspergillus niger]|nr:hypothetical protein CBS63078_3817 [Aspergillus niger]
MRGKPPFVDNVPRRMHPSLEHIDTCVPVTALKALELRDVKLLLQAQGTYIRLIDEGSGDLLAELKAFKRNHVHGFVALSQQEQVAGPSHARFIAWGGQSVRAFDLFFSAQESSASLVAASAEYQGPDWILAGCASSHEESTTAYVLTAHNAVLGLHIVDGDRSKHEKAVHIKPLVTGVNTILYSADIVALSESHILIAAGTVFGEIIVWSSYLNESGGAVGSIHHFFTGHEGSIFGVRVSPSIASLRGNQSGRLLASCSDDRTIRIWDISDCERTSRHDAPAYSTDGFELRSTGFGAVAHDNEVGSEKTIASAFGHLARIWGVNFLTVGEGLGKVNLISRGEDATCILWDLTWDPSTQTPQFKLTEGISILKHTGKHVWSLEVRSTDTEAVIYTGGADGAVKNFTIKADEKGSLVLPNLHNRITMTIDTQNQEPHVETSIKGFDFVSQNEFVAVTARGEVQVGHIKAQKLSNQHIFKETMFVEDDLRSYSVVGSLPQEGIALVGNARGLIRLYNHNVKSLIRLVEVGQRPLILILLDYKQISESEADLVFTVSYPNSETAELFMVSLSGDEPSVDKITVNLPYGFGMASASLVCGKQYLALGSLTGNFALYRVAKTESIEPVMPPSKLHGREGLSYITSFSSLYGEEEQLNPYFLTCGRSGTYGVHRLVISEGPEPSISLQTLHLASLAFNCEIQGAYIDKVSQDLMIYGFQPMDFVLWNESAQTEVARHKCNGGRRAWAFQPNNTKAWAGSLLWIQSGFSGMEIQPDASRTLRSGSHGREVKAMCATQQGGLGPLFATGSEDTNVRIFAPRDTQSENRWGAFKCLRLLREHHTGLQSVGWSTNGRFLFTSGGYEQFFVWRTHSIPRFGLGTTLDGECPKSDPNSDLRTTSFDVLEVEDEQAEGSFLICLTYSNSTIKIFHYTSSAEGGSFILLANGTYMSNCLTQANFMLKGSSLSLITASTDGYFTLWDLTSVLEPFYTITSPLRLKQTIHGASIIPSTISCKNRYQIHWNSIKSLELADLSDTLSLIVAAGDDNSMTVTLLDTGIENGEATCTIAVPDAHAACITTTKILTQHVNPSDGTARFAVASSGNDHQVKIWWIDIDMKMTGPDRIQISKAAERYSSVADISSLDILHGASGSQLVVCGTGMEMLRLQL